MGGLMSIKTSILFPQFRIIISLSPALWFWYPRVLYDVNILSNESSTYLYTGKKEGHIFGDHVKNIFPNHWDLDFSNNDDFYYSGVKKIEDSLKSNNKKVIFSYQENGHHNETSWATAILEILGKLIWNLLAPHFKWYLLLLIQEEIWIKLCSKRGGKEGELNFSYIVQMWFLKNPYDNCGPS